MGSRGTSPVMVGRDAELGILRAVFASGASGVPHVALLSGEAGIGKTRLITEFLAEVSAARQEPPVVVAIGQCVDLGDIGAPFTPVRRMLRALYVAVGDRDFRDAAGSLLAVKTLGTIVPDLAPDSDASPDVAPAYLAEAIELLIVGLSEVRHIVIVFEDLHWADAATLTLLKDLSITLRAAHVTTVMTYRSNHVGREHPLHSLLGDLERNRAVTLVPLRRLGTADSETVARAVRPDLDAREAALVAARSEGVPFFIEELVDLAYESRGSGAVDGHGDPAGSLPGSLRDLVLARYERLSPLTAGVVATVAAGGVRVDEELLAEVFDGDPSELHRGLHEAIDAGVLVPDRDGYRFRHALIRAAVHDDLLRGERIDLHLRYAGALQGRVDAGHAEDAAELAEHWLTAGDVPSAFDATLIAREHAKDTLAPIAAASLGERLLDLWLRVPGARQRAGQSRGALALEIAQAYEDGGERDQSLSAAQAGVAYTEPREKLLRASLLFEVASRLRTSGRRSQACEVFASARELLNPSGTPPERALIARIDAARILIDPTLETSAVDLIDRAVALAEGSGDNAALGMILFTRAQWFGDRGDLAGAGADLHRVAELHADVRTHLSAMVNLSGHLIMTGAFRECLETAQRGLDEAVFVGQERGLGAFLLLNIAEAQIDLGEVGTGLAHAEGRCPTSRALPTSRTPSCCSWRQRRSGTTTPRSPAPTGTGSASAT